MARMAEFGVGQLSKSVAALNLKPGHVYLIRDKPAIMAEVVHYKVGQSNDREKRISDLQTGNPRKLEFSSEVAVNDMNKAERAAKAALGEYKCTLGGGIEWFTVPAGGEEKTLVKKFQDAVANCNT